MNFNVYCDESSPEVLRDKLANRFMILGSLWLPVEYKAKFKEMIHLLKEEYSYHNEIKWNKVSPSSLDFYLALVNRFFSEKNLRFRALVVEAEKIDLVRFHHDDGELSFYKFYYQLLHHWIYDYNEYSIFLDLKVNKDRNRVHKLWEVLNSANLFSTIKNVQSLPSNESVGIQFADLFTGCINGKLNDKITSTAKQRLIAEIEHIIKHPIQPTTKAEVKFNIFRINLQGGW
ncbi:MAG: DUF3800 domain-containing protein [Candidatus Brocadiales bacterium]|nr:DUF3800 domain-containing protein [Candidatus Brocadiales bacterium]